MRPQDLPVVVSPTISVTGQDLLGPCLRARGLARVTNSPAVHGAPPARTQERGVLARAHRDLLGGPPLPSSYYEIRVVGILPPEILLDFERLSASVEPVETILHGPLRDQAALHGLLARLQTFGVQYGEVRLLHDA